MRPYEAGVARESIKNSEISIKLGLVQSALKTSDAKISEEDLFRYILPFKYFYLHLLLLISFRGHQS